MIRFKTLVAFFVILFLATTVGKQIQVPGVSELAVSLTALVVFCGLYVMMSVDKIESDLDIIKKQLESRK
ncbi:hypothetical protein A3C89_02910 [Candidatus Kaiserbacteria bacterium RIFCSPHIGHO2_02_FULL_50_50]|uniref:Uncharacterized protein n=1 Tax=Candidatus Kaiserbacteria bacterium RIFCSPHIGHO2_02_FULL_50_50 TaxID=1798492 RepID=A0A1F6DDD1_9BACT|nr:MAG: hypothetical protein A3C89_02910 [Candidatus Kaiserbacteria bacterium RIFCSPHIGHO2_02_FULL_50_50]OGG89120.1 MAG: hypothetical protein A3G62_00020 [Candidatus Kaiserbacteria bacterium RIFCSPLOWO2_12_FULL_50_10]